MHEFFELTADGSSLPLVAGRDATAGGGGFDAPALTCSAVASLFSAGTEEAAAAAGGDGSSC